MKLKPPAAWRECTGIAVGACVAGCRLARHVITHAHDGGNYRGWICVTTAQRCGSIAWRRDGPWAGSITRPSDTLWHELAHLKVLPGSAHGPSWQAMMRHLGQPAEEHWRGQPVAEVEARLH